MDPFITKVCFRVTGGIVISFRVASAHFCPKVNPFFMVSFIFFFFHHNIRKKSVCSYRLLQVSVSVSTNVSTILKWWIDGWFALCPVSMKSHSRTCSTCEWNGFMIAVVSNLFSEIFEHFPSCIIHWIVKGMLGQKKNEKKLRFQSDKKTLKGGKRKVN